ncbi:MAG TPA: RDD family protein [Chloroflexia bacterium]|nr:RDD family protein [Chloroflexia bacterium]
MTLQRRHLPLALLLGALLGIGLTLTQWRLSCRVPASEACVWGRAYLPISLVLGAAAGLVVAGVAFVVIRLIGLAPSSSPRAPVGPTAAGEPGRQASTATSMTEMVRYAGFWRRVGAGLIDLALWIPVVVMLYWLESVSRAAAILSAVLGSALYYAYVLPLTKRFGGTLGKLAVGIRVRPVDGSTLQWDHVVRRSAVDMVSSATILAAVIIGLSEIPFEAYRAASWTDRTGVLTQAVPWYPWATNAYMLWVLSEFLVILLNRKRRALHDFIAGTIVVLARPLRSPSKSFGASRQVEA